MQSRSAAALEQILADYFEVPVEVEQFVGAWYRLDPDSQTRVEDGDSDAECLGFGVVVGDDRVGPAISRKNQARTDVTLALLAISCRRALHTSHYGPLPGFFPMTSLISKWN